MKSCEIVGVLLTRMIRMGLPDSERRGVPVSPCCVPDGVPALEHRRPMKQHDFPSVFQCSSRFREKIWRARYLRDSDNGFAVRGLVQPKFDWHTGSQTHKSSAIT